MSDMNITQQPEVRLGDFFAMSRTDTTQIGVEVERRLFLHPALGFRIATFHDSREVCNVEYRNHNYIRDPKCDGSCHLGQDGRLWYDKVWSREEIARMDAARRRAELRDIKAAKVNRIIGRALGALMLLTLAGLLVYGCTL